MAEDDRGFMEQAEMNVAVYRSTHPTMPITEVEAPVSAKEEGRRRVEEEQDNGVQGQNARSCGANACRVTLNIHH